MDDPEVRKKCPKCKEYLPLSCFSVDRKTKDGLRSHCKECNRFYKQKYAQEDPIKVTWTGARSRAKRNGLPYETNDELMLAHLREIWVDTCPYLEIPLVWGHGSGSGGNSNSPSLDRIIPELGYTIDNVQWISHKANTMKQDASMEEVKRFASAIFLAFNTSILAGGTSEEV